MAPTGEGVGWPRPIPVDEHQGMPPAWHEPVTSKRGSLGVGQLGCGLRHDSGRGGVWPAVSMNPVQTRWTLRRGACAAGRV